jgi:hypothetical protein
MEQAAAYVHIAGGELYPAISWAAAARAVRGYSGLRAGLFNAS